MTDTFFHLGEVKREAFDLSSLKSKLQHVDKGCCSHDSEEECNEYLLEYPLNQRRCVAALENLHLSRAKLEAEFRSEIQELEKKYQAKYQPLYDQRAALVQGLREPTPQEYGDVPEDAVAELNEKGEPIIDSTTKGLPEFWLTALKNHPAVSEMITEDDIPALAFLEDVKIGHINGSPGFRLEFVFGENPFFKNKSLVKEYYLAEPNTPLAEDYIYDHAVGTPIEWKEGKNLCFKTVTKTQRQKNGKGTRVVKREEPVESFFHFFSPPTIPEDEGSDSEEDDVEELEQELEADYEMGDLIKSEIVPNAIHWFTGKALDYSDYSNYYGDEEDDEEDYEDSDEDDSEEDSEDDDRKKPFKFTGAARNGQKQDCQPQ